MTSMEDLHSMSLRDFCDLRDLCRRGAQYAAFDAYMGSVLDLLPWIASWLTKVLAFE